MTTAEIVSLIFEGSSYVAEAIAAFIDGDTSEPVRRVIEVLPSSTRSKVELERQRALNRRALEAELARLDGFEELPGE